ncbi:DUF3307 domain-containing protein [Patescibacteria group bacterium]|nr:DUF3307 domain-containing protein [Patescibacteria group bacterium]MBU1016056.1 DUF3307 domain-containing protein [Patescibacteria group bacterium]MBU1684760.1 DUF3307 domain-containing protein [Patescibacteria group bacterium]MBU1938674.1 DUF3307 domain-containing protein [Patescibacteria group bacterium]
MTLFVYLYFIHFLADYTFQSSAIVKYKSEHFLGVVIHTTVHLLLLLIVLAPFLPDNKVWLSIGVIYVTHIMMDQTKVTLNRVRARYIRFFYFADQIAHLLIATACAWYIGPLMPKYLTGQALSLYTSQSFVLYLLILTLVTYFYDVTRYFVRRDYLKKPYRRDYRTMLINAGIVTVAFGVCWIAY